MLIDVVMVIICLLIVKGILICWSICLVKFSKFLIWFILYSKINLLLFNCVKVFLFGRIDKICFVICLSKLLLVLCFKLLFIFLKWFKLINIIVSRLWFCFVVFNVIDNLLWNKCWLGRLVSLL